MRATKPSPGPCANVDSVCRKYGLQLPSPQCLQPEKAPLERLPIRSSLLVQLYTKLPTSSIQMYKINVPILGSCWCISIKAYSPQLFCICVCPFFLPSLLQSGQPYSHLGLDMLSRENHPQLYLYCPAGAPVEWTPEPVSSAASSQ